MKNVFLLLLLVGLAAAGWVNRDKILKPKVQPVEPSESEAAAVRGAPTPHPAVESRAAALKAYPGLGIKDSPINQRFLALYETALRSEPALLQQADWPSKLAQRAATPVTNTQLAPAARPTLSPLKVQATSMEPKKKGPAH